MASFLNSHRFVAGASVLALCCAASAAHAQTPGPALPTAPGAEKAVQGAPPTSARASLPGDNGSPVEPYLFLFILAGGGIVSAIAAGVTDRRVRASHALPKPTLF